MIFPLFITVLISRGNKETRHVPGHCFHLLFPECKQGYANALLANEWDLAGFWLPSSNFTIVHCSILSSSGVVKYQQQLKFVRKQQYSYNYFTLIQHYCAVSKCVTTKSLFKFYNVYHASNETICI